ncbi:MAG: carboxypeptidase-like regulatory domain-containing protein [Bacteroidales bacterium]|nr:carboxypeptidase-like regulatory domain-containing protein [Bacteroidales bacterium]
MAGSLHYKYITGYFLLTLVLFLTPELYAQKIVHISGRVVDKTSRQPIPFANIILEGTGTGTLTDFDGKYKLDVPWSEGKIQAQLIGYQEQTRPFKPEANLVLNFALKPKTFNLNEVTVSAKRERYRNKGNPAVALIRDVIKNKDNNRKSSLEYYQYYHYNKLELALNKLDDKVLQSKVFQKFRLAQYADTSSFDGEVFLPFFLKESASEVYFRKSPAATKEYVTGTKVSGMPGYLDKQGVNSTVDRLIQNFDIYDNNILVLTNPFVSPISVMAPNIYKFRIIDTVKVANDSCINVAFEPRNKVDLAFSGHLYITKDNRYAVAKVELSIPKQVNLNFVRGLRYVQTYQYVDNKIWMPSMDELTVDLNVTKNGMGILTKSSDYYSHYVLNRKAADSVYSGVNKKIILPVADDQSSVFWKENRTVPLKKEENNVYVMTDSLQHLPAYKHSVNLMMLLGEGYWRFGKIDLGPTNTFYSFNDVEGNRVRLSARTSPQFNKRIQISGNVAYGFKDQKYKYGGSLLLSLNKIALNARPTQTLFFKYQNDIEFPGMKMEFINDDNFFLSFKRGVADKMLYYQLYEVQHYRNWGSGFSTTFTLMHRNETPGGNWQFQSADFPLDHLTTSEASLKLRYAPNERYYQGMSHRSMIITKYPVFQLTYTQGFKGVWNSQYNYSELSASVFKRIYLGFFGYVDNEVEAGKVFGSRIPYPLLYLHRANQTYSYQTYSYNMMNFLEFVSDHYAAYFGEYHLNGWFFNQIPLIKHLKFRGVVTFKALFGGLDDINNPNITPGLMLFPTDAYGKPTTFALNNTPYMEAGVGVENIFKVFRVDFIKRLTYLNNPYVSPYGVRVSVYVVF